MDVATRFNVTTMGCPDGQPMVFAHGFGCDQNMWRFVAPSFERDYRVVLFDHVGAGGSDLSAYRPDKYASLSGYADDVVEIGRELIAVKEAIGHGNFTPWLNEQFGWTERTARNYMSVAEQFASKRKCVSGLPLATVYKLAAPIGATLPALGAAMLTYALLAARNR